MATAQRSCYVSSEGVAPSPLFGAPPAASALPAYSPVSGTGPVANDAPSAPRQSHLPRVWQALRGNADHPPAPPGGSSTIVLGPAVCAGRTGGAGHAGGGGRADV